jgi:hypothetical protein
MLVTILPPLVSVALLAQAAGGPVDIAWPETGHLALSCPVNQTTRVVFPEPLRRLKTFGPDRQAIAVTVERAAPTAVIVVRPQRHPAQAGIEFRGVTLTLQLDLTTTAAGQPQESRLALPVLATAAPRATPAPGDSAPSRVRLDNAPVPAEPSATPTPRSAGTSDGDPASQQLLWADAQPIGRREGLPGQPTLVLEDALSSDEWIWYRMRLEGGAREQVTAIEWERGPISDVQQRTAGADRRILVRVPRRFVNRHTRLVLRLASGAVYHVPPFPPTLRGFFKRLFR